jgi:hypothetical protein
MNPADVIVGIPAGIAACAGPEQHHPLKAVAIELSERGSKALQDRIVTGWFLTDTYHRSIGVVSHTSRPLEWKASVAFMSALVRPHQS